MKKLLFTLPLLLAGTLSYAEDSGKIYTIWPQDQGIEGSEPLSLDDSQNALMTVQQLEENGISYYHLTTNPNSPYALFGFGTSQDPTEIVNGNYDIVFDIRSTDNFNLHMKVELNGNPAEPLFDFVRNGEWQTMRISLNENYQSVLERYSGYDDSKISYFFLPVIKGPNDGVNEEYTLDVTKIRLEPYKRTEVEAGTTYFGNCVVTTPFLSLIEYEIKVNNDQTFTILANFTPETTPGFDHKIEIDRDGFELINMTYYPTGYEETGYQYVYTAQNSYIVGDQLNFNFRIPVSGGVISAPVNYQFGWSNSPLPLTPITLYNLESLNHNSATIKFESLLPKSLEGSTVTYYVGDQSIEKQWVISDLKEETEYTYNVVAIAEKDGKEYKAEPIEVSFRTLREDARDKLYFGSFTVTFNDSYFKDENGETDRKSNTVNFDYILTHTREGKIKLDLSSEPNFFKIEGMVPSMNIFLGLEGDNKSEEVAIKENQEIISSKSYITGQELRIQFWFAYNGGATEANINYTVGQESAPGIILSAQNVTSNSAEISYDVIGLSETEYPVQSVTYKNVGSDEEAAIWDGGNPIKLENLQDATEYTYEVSVSLENYAETLSATVSFTTPAFQGETSDIIGNIWRDVVSGTNNNNVEYEIPYYVVVNPDLSISVYFNLISNPEVKGLEKELYIPVGARLTVSESGNPDYPYIGSYPATDCKPGDQISGMFRFPYEGGLIEQYFTYIFGSSSAVARISEIAPQPWSPAVINLEDVIGLPERYSIDNIEVTVQPKNHSVWSEDPTQENTGLYEWQWNVYEEIMNGSVTPGEGGDTKNGRCDGYLLTQPKAELVEGTIDNHVSILLDVDCSGLYEITLTGKDGLKFSEGNGAAFNSAKLIVSVYPTFTHKYSYTHTNNNETAQVTDDVFSINGRRFNGEFIYYPKDAETLAELSNAQIFIPGVFDATIYYWIDSTVPSNGPQTMRAKKQASANSLPEGYEDYTNSFENGSPVDLSALANGGTLHLVMAKNGAVTPLASGSQSETNVRLELTDDEALSVSTIGSENDGLVDIYTLSGLRVAKGVDFDEIRNSLTPGLYIVGGKKVVIK